MVRHAGADDTLAPPNFMTTHGDFFGRCIAEEDIVGEHSLRDTHGEWGVGSFSKSQPVIHLYAEDVVRHRVAEQ